MPLPFQETAAALLVDAESLLVNWLPNGKRNGREWEVGSLGGEAGRSLRVNMATGRWSDFSDSQTSGGDLISLYAAIHQIDNGKALLKLHELYPYCANGHAKQNGQAKPSTPPPVTLAPAPDSSRPPVEHSQHGNPSKTWAYRNEEGDTIGIVCRFDGPDGKQVLPLIHTTTGWKWKGFPDPRPLYNLDLLTVRAKAPVLIVEGEKTADAAAAYFPTYVVTTWPGGSKAVSKADWTILKQRDCVIWPDNDKPGLDAATDISARLQKSRVIVLPAGLPEKWDLADPIPDGIDIHKVLNPPPVAVATVTLESAQPDELPFRILGYTSDKYCYLPNGKNCVTELTASAHNTNNLLDLAPLDFWETKFPGKSGFSSNTAVSWLMQSCKRMGYFDNSKRRGRGCWIDEGRVVFHSGTHLCVDGKVTDLGSFKSKFIYEQGKPLPNDSVLPMTSAEGQAFIDICEELPWDERTPVNAYLFAGWCALAPICGALWWRPHMWLTGKRGTGKTWVLERIIKELLGSACIFGQGATTEAGIRQSMEHDALPVVTDETETERSSDADRQQAINLLARQCSSDTQAMQIKGSASGKAVQYTLRAMFCFSSIGVAVVSAADTSRITVMELKRRNDPAKFDNLKNMYRDLFSPDAFSSSFRARAVSNAVTTCNNGKVFARVLADRLGDQRTADQMAILLAGCHSLTSDKLLTPEQATKFLSSFDLKNPTEDSIGESDEDRCLNFLLDSKIRSGNGYEQTVQEYLTQAFSTEEPAATIAQDTLTRHGLRKVEEGWAVCSGHKAIETIYEDSNWSKGKWRGILKRIEGVTERRSRFGPYGSRRSLHFPKKEDGSLF